MERGHEFRQPFNFFWNEISSSEVSRKALSFSSSGHTQFLERYRTCFRNVPGLGFFSYTCPNTGNSNYRFFADIGNFRCAWNEHQSRLSKVFKSIQTTANKLESFLFQKIFWLCEILCKSWIPVPCWRYHYLPRKPSRVSKRI